MLKSHEVLREVFEDTSPKKVADHAGLSVSMIYKWSEEPGETGSGAVNPLDRVISLIESTKDDRIIKWLSCKSDGFFMKNPESSDKEEKELMQEANQILQEFAQLLHLIARAAADCQISGKEAAEIRRNWQDLKSTTEGFVNHCEMGEFNEIKDQMRRSSKKFS